MAVRISEMNPVESASGDDLIELAIKDELSPTGYTTVHIRIADLIQATPVSENPYFEYGRVTPNGVVVHYQTPKQLNNGDDVDEDNIAIALAPLGSGGITASIPDGGIGGDPRGTYSIDLQRDRTEADRIAESYCSTIINGQDNKVYDSPISTIISGNNNTIEHGASNTIIGGSDNRIDQNEASNGASNSVIFTGHSNTILGGSQNAIISGFTNRIDGYSQNSILNGSQSIIEGGGFNSISNGSSNIIRDATFSHIGSGGDNKISGNGFCFIGSGTGNEITDSNFSNIVSGGDGLITNHSFSSIVSGSGNKIISDETEDRGNFNIIGSGGNNKIIIDSLDAVSHSGILAGDSNTIRGGFASSISSGSGNKIFYSDVSFIANGYGNNIGDTSNEESIEGTLNISASAIIASTTSKIFQSNSFIAGGNTNVIGVDAGFASSIIGGIDNQIGVSYRSDEEYGNNFNSIVGGTGNRSGGFSNLTTGLGNINVGFNNFVGGTSNEVDEAKSSLIHGSSNQVSYAENVFVGGNSNEVDESENSLVHGSHNQVSQSKHIFVVGNGNTLESLEVPTEFVVVSGQNNNISEGTSHTTIMGSSGNSRGNQFQNILSNESGQVIKMFHDATGISLDEEQIIDEFRHSETEKLVYITGKVMFSLDDGSYAKVINFKYSFNDTIIPVLTQDTEIEIGGTNDLSIAFDHNISFPILSTKLVTSQTIESPWSALIEYDIREFH